MDHYEYSRKIDSFSECNAENLISLEKWVASEGIPWLWSELSGVLSKPKPKHPNARSAPKLKILKPISDADAIRMGLIVSLSDKRNMPLEKSYYQAQLTMLDAEANLYCKSIAAFPKEESAHSQEIKIKTLHSALIEMMNFGRILLAEAANLVAGVPNYYEAGRAPFEHPFHVFKSAEQLIYGTYSGMTHTDRSTYASVAVLRTAIELRIRDAFCLYAYSNPKQPDELIPLDMSKVFEAIESHQDNIKFAVDIHDVKKIYRWSNSYLHAGNRDFPWVAGFLARYLNPLFTGKDVPSKGFDINNGIRMNRDTLQQVRMTLLSKREVPFTQRLTNAWRALWNKDRQSLELPPFNEKSAACVFLD